MPDVLSRQEVRDLRSAVNTRHNRAYLWTTYSRGLRLNEALHLQVGDVDGRRMMPHVHRGKGAKDRDVILTEPDTERTREIIDLLMQDAASVLADRG